MMVSNEKAADYGFAQEFLKSNSEIRGLVSRAADENYTLSRFEYELRQTGWYRKRTAAQRDWEVLKKTQPREAQERKTDARFLVQRMAEDLGANLSSKERESMAERMIQYDWSEQELRYRVGKEWRYQDGGIRDGLGYQAHQELTEMAGAYGVSFSDRTIEEWAGQVAVGTSSVEGFRDYMVEKAKGKYVGIADDLDKGMTTDQMFDAYRQEASRTLGVAASTVSVTDKGYNNVFAFTAPGEKQRRAMTLDEFTQMLRKDEQFGFDESQNAESLATGLAAAIQTDFGARG